MKVVLVTGAAGFLGRCLLKELMNCGNYKIIAFDIKEEFHFQDTVENNNLVYYSLSDFNAGINIIENVDIIINCAFARDNSGASLLASLEFTYTFFTRCADAKKSIINISSRSVYGQNPATPWTEKTLVNPNNLYALSKSVTEQMSNWILKDNSYYTNLRLAGLVGVGMEQRIVNKFIDNVLRGENIQIKGGKQVFSFLNVQDATDAILILLTTNPKYWENAYNVGSACKYNIIELAEMVTYIAKNNFGINAGYNIELDDNITLFDEMDTSMFSELTNWHPKISMEQTIKSIFKYKINQL